MGIPIQRMALALTLLIFLTTVFYLTQDTKATSHAPTIAILSMTTAETSYDWMSMSNKYDYASKHSYDLIWSFKAPVAPSNFAKHWHKIDIIEDAVQSTLSGKTRYGWLWMLDYDTLITNPSIRVEEVIEQGLLFAEGEGKSRDQIELILTRDCEPLNIGSMFLKVSPWLLEFLKEWRSGLQPETPNRSEQDVLQDMLLDNVLGSADVSVVVPQTMFNAYPDELNHCLDERNSRSWEKGMFVIHFPGANWWLKDDDAVGRLMRKYHGRAFPEEKSQAARDLYTL